VTESYSVEVLKKQKRKGAKITNAFTNANSFVKPVDNIGNKSIPDYVAYANSHIYNVNIPGCGQPGRMFVGQRADPFVVNLGETFDLVNLNPLGEPDAKPNTLADKNVTSMILEVHTDCLLAQGDTTIAAWTTASLRQKQTLRNKPRFLKSAKQKGDWIQVSRLANPLVNELVIGLKDKDRFNSSSPHKDAYFATYVTNPTLPELLELLFGVTAPNQFPRTDLVSIFLTGVEGLNKTNATAELMRLNTAIAPKAAAAQSNLGVLGGDTSGYPNGRRPGDDVVEFR
ncbi:MAG: DUF4331 domain-containing protein, partial [Bdellovibrionales bacterium]|nr:DUF4331 domain-containing protein [Bdellovibrionales bacterium]